MDQFYVGDNICGIDRLKPSECKERGNETGDCPHKRVTYGVNCELVSCATCKMNYAIFDNQ